MQGVVLANYNIVRTLIEKTSTNTGLRGFARIVHKHFDIGIKTDKHQVNFDGNEFNLNLPKLSYKINA